MPHVRLSARVGRLFVERVSPEVRRPNDNPPARARLQFANEHRVRECVAGHREGYASSKRENTRWQSPSRLRCRTSGSPPSAPRWHLSNGERCQTRGAGARASGLPISSGSSIIGVPGSTGVRTERRLNALPQFTTELLGQKLHFIRSRISHHDERRLGGNYGCEVCRVTTF